MLTWLSILVICIIFELITLSFTTLWVGIGALCAVVLELMGKPLWMQIGVAILVSGLLIVFVRPYFMYHRNEHKRRTRMEEFIGRQGIVTGEIDKGEEGVVTTDQGDWRARCVNRNEALPVGCAVIVKRVEGKMLVVTRKN